MILSNANAMVIAAEVLFGSGGVTVLYQAWIHRKSENRRETHEDHELWYKAAEQHYETAVEEAREAKRDSAKCWRELDKTRRVIYRLLDDLEDDIIMALMLPDVDISVVRRNARAVIARARDALMADQNNTDNS